MKALCKKYGGFFLQDTLKKVGYSGATLARILKASDYNLCLNSIILIADVITTLQLRMFLSYCKFEEIELPQELEQLSQSKWSDIADKKKFLEDTVNSLKPLASHFETFISLQSEKDENWNLLNTFLWTDVSAMLQLLRSIQTGNFEERLIAMKRMIPLFYAMDNTHYKRWAPIDLALKASTYPKDLIKTYSEEGVWRSAASDRIGGWMPSDQIHEVSRLFINCYQNDNDIDLRCFITIP